MKNCKGGACQEDYEPEREMGVWKEKNDGVIEGQK